MKREMEIEERKREIKRGRERKKHNNLMYSFK